MECLECGTIFEASRSWQKYCTQKCKQRAESRRRRRDRHDDVLAATQAWRDKNKAYVLTYATQYRAEHAEEIKAKRRELRQLNPDKEPAEQRKAYWADPEKARKRRKDQYWADPERAAELHQIRYQANPEYFRKRSRDYYQLNIEGRREYDRLYREANREKRGDWWKANPEKSKAYRHERQARKRGKPSEKIDIIAVFNRDNWTCQLCGEPVDPSASPRTSPSASLDHIIPVSHPDYPGHLWNNVQLAHYGCNSRKKNRLQ